MFDFKACEVFKIRSPASIGGMTVLKTSVTKKSDIMDRPYLIQIGLFIVIDINIEFFQITL